MKLSNNKGITKLQVQYVTHLIERKVCASRFPCIKSAETVSRESVNNHKSAHRKFRNALFNPTQQNSQHTQTIPRQIANEFFECVYGLITKTLRV